MRTPPEPFCHRETPASLTSGFRTTRWRHEVKRNLIIHQLQYTVCWVVCSAIHCHSTLFLDKKNPLFKELHRTLDHLFCHLHEGRAGRQVKHAKVKEIQLWESRELGTKTLENDAMPLFHIYLLRS